MTNNNANVVERLLDRVERLTSELAIEREKNAVLTKKVASLQGGEMTQSIADRLRKALGEEENTLRIVTPESVAHESVNGELRREAHSRLRSRAYLNSVIGESTDPIFNLRPTKGGIFTIFQIRHVQTEFDATMEGDPLRHATKVIEDMASKYKVSVELMRVIVNRVSYYTDENIAKFIAEQRKAWKS